ncbi:hypothetical protein AYO44_08510 [Planctomycetaceae bacterium SCGC AG-212-F19]|nr:hypothetical protein AYO44_08510 [Planctomycetaceae bacterium SCGC AG-212-F19]
MFAFRYLFTVPVLFGAMMLTSAPAQELTAKQLDGIWTDFIRNDEEGTKKALQGIAALAKSPKAAVPFLKDRLKPVPVADAKKINQAIADLDSANFQAREQASKTLEAIGVVAVPAIEKKLGEKLSLEPQQRLEAILQKIDDRPMTTDELRASRAIEALEAIGTPEARAILDTLAKGGAGALVTERAQQALGRVQRRVAAK